MSSSPSCWQFEEVGKPLANAPFELKQLNRDEVTVEIAGCGLCHTDLGFIFDGVRTNLPLPLTLGHEISGRVVDAGEEAQSWIGKAVVISAVIPCGVCDHCRRGLGTICRNQKMPGNDIQGGFATHIQVPANGLCEVDEQRLAAAGLELADISVIADALTTPYQAAVQAEVERGDLVIVIGVGGVGGYAVQVAQALGAVVVAIDIDADKLATLTSYDASLTIDASATDGREIKKQLKAFAKEQGLRQTEWKVFECSGSIAGQQTAYSLLTFGGTLAVVGFTMEKLELRLSNLMAFHARAMGNWGCPPELYPDALELVLEGKVALGPFIEKHPLDEINQVIETAHHHQLRQRAILVP